MNLKRNFCFGIVFVLIAGVTTIQAETDNQLQSLNQQMRQAMRAKNWDKAIKIGLHFASVAPNRNTPAYNLACSYARKGDSDSAIDWLSKAAENGFSYVASMLRDDDLDSIRKHPDYETVLAKIKQNNAHNFERFVKEVAPNAIVKLFRPRNYNASKPAPLIVALHGMGSNANQFARHWKSLANEFDAILAVPQGMGKMGNGGYHWGTAEQGMYLVTQAIEKASNKYNVDKKRIILTGFSQGASVSFMYAIKHPQNISGIIPMSGYYDSDFASISSMVHDSHKAGGPNSTENSQVSGDSNLTSSSQPYPRFYIINGSQDREADNNRLACKLLKEAGVKAEVKIFPGVGHAFPPNAPKEFRIALEFVLVE